MPPEQPAPGSPADWLRHARSDLALARVPLPQDTLYSELCYHAQQAVEKSLKAVLIQRGIEFRRVHDIAYLLGLLPAEIVAPPELAEAASLTSYAVVTRYPGDHEDVTPDMHRDAVRVPLAMLSWAEQMIGERDGAR